MAAETVTITGPADGGDTDPARLAVALWPHAAALGLTQEQVIRAAAAVCKGRTTLVAAELASLDSDALMDEVEACGCTVTVVFHPVEPEVRPIRSMSAKERDVWLATGRRPTTAAPESTG